MKQNSNAELMSHYGITIENKVIFRYKNYQYDTLKDALNYAIREFENGMSHDSVIPDKVKP